MTGIVGFTLILFDFNQLKRSRNQLAARKLIFIWYNTFPFAFHLYAIVKLSGAASPITALFIFQIFIVTL